MIGFRRTSHATGVALLCLLAILAATARAGEPVGSAANVVYPVDYTAQKARLFEEIDLPLIAPPPADALLARRYCAGGQARLLAIMLGPVIGANIHRLDARAVATFGLTMFALFAYLSSRFSPDVDFWTLALTRLIMGVGLSSLFLPLTTIYLSGLSAERTASAAGLANFMRNLGSSFGTSIMTSLWAHRTTQFEVLLAEQVAHHHPAASTYLDQLAQLGMDPRTALAYVSNEVIAAQASLLATNAVMLISAVLMLALIVVIWFARPPFSAAGAGH